MSENFDWLHSHTDVCKVDLYSPKVQKEQDPKVICFVDVSTLNMEGRDSEDAGGSGSGGHVILEKLKEKEIIVIKDTKKQDLSKHILLVQRQMSVVAEDAAAFQVALRRYAHGAAARRGCLRISIQKLSNEPRYMIYEFWEDSSVWNSHLQTNYSKTFQRSNVDFLETPELTSTMLVPASWWTLNNN